MGKVANSDAESSIHARTKISLLIFVLWYRRALIWLGRNIAVVEVFCSHVSHKTLFDDCLRIRLGHFALGDDGKNCA